MLITKSKALLALALSLCAGCSDGPNRLRNSTAQSMLQSVLGTPTLDVLVGPISFGSKDASDIATGNVPRKLYPMYDAFAKNGLLKLENERQLTGEFSGWNDFLASTQFGISRVATFSLTDLGAKRSHVGSEENRRREVTFSIGHIQIKKIVSNEPIDVSGDKYRIVMGTVQADISKEMKDAWMAAGQPADGQQRFRALLKYDPFDATWQLQSLDMGNANAPFSSERVPSSLARLRGGATR